MKVADSQTLPLDSLLAFDSDAQLRLLGHPTVLRNQLAQHSVVRQLAAQFLHNAISDSELADFVSSLLADFRKGRPFSHDLTMTALVVAIQDHFSLGANKLINELSQLRIVEMISAPGTARLVDADRQRRAAWQRREVVATSLPIEMADFSVIYPIDEPPSVAVETMDLGELAYA
jgi:hypothetical protein